MIICGDSRDVLSGMEAESVDAVVTDPPYELGFMGKAWDGSGVAYGPIWREVARVLKPGGHLLSFGGSRTYHRLACAIEDAGLEIRDQIMWLYGSGFPKSLDVSKAIDKAAGAEREVVGTRPIAYPDSDCWGTPNSGSSNLGAFSGDLYGNGELQVGYGKGTPITAPATPDAHRWNGWGTALKPAHEPICVARKPLMGTVAANVLEHDTGALNVDACRVRAPAGDREEYGIDGDESAGRNRNTYSPHDADRTPYSRPSAGRWPANVCHDGSEEVLERMPETGGGGAPARFSNPGGDGRTLKSGWNGEDSGERIVFDSGSAARFFYCAKATSAERQAHNVHPTVKPVALMRWLVRLVTPPGGLVLDPFLGSGTTGIACEHEGFRWLGIEKDPHYAAIARQRIRDDEGAADRTKLEGRAPADQLKTIAGPLFD